MILGIDASNIRRGGGVTHLVELLEAADPLRFDFTRTFVWGGQKTLAALPTRPWLEKISHPALDRGLMSRTIWHATRLYAEASRHHVDCLFVPGGMDLSGYGPMVTMNQNLLPFDTVESRRFRSVLRRSRLWLLRHLQSRTMRRAQGVIFLTHHAKDVVSPIVGRIDGHVRVVPHGINPRFFLAPRRQRCVAEYTVESPCRVLYVSIIDEYKNQGNVAVAVKRLRDEGVCLELDFVGPAEPQAWKSLEKVLDVVDPKSQFIRYHGPVGYREIHDFYRKADVHVFASSCETFGQILTEAMAAGLPNVCSRRAAMPEILGSAGQYFEPADPVDLAAVLQRVIQCKSLREEMADAAFQRAFDYTWASCARSTFELLAEVARAGS